MDRVAETTSVVVVERKSEESAEASEPKTTSPGTRKRPATGEVEPDKTLDANACKKKKKKPTEWLMSSDVIEFGEACDKLKTEWDWARGKTRELYTMMRDTNDRIEDKWFPDQKEFDRLYGPRAMDRSEGEGLRRDDEFWKRELTRMELFEDLRALTREALKIVRNRGECQECMLRQLQGPTERLKKLHERI